MLKENLNYQSYNNDAFNDNDLMYNKANAPIEAWKGNPPFW